MSGGDSLTLDGSMSMSDSSDPENPPGNMIYGWVLNGTIVLNGTSPAHQSSTVTIPWDPNPLDPTAQSLTGTFGFSKGVSANTYNVTIAVADFIGSASATTTVTVAANSDPIPYISSSNGVNADDEIHIRAFDSLNLDGTMTTDADMFDTRTYSWDILDDGTIEFTGQFQSIVTISWDDLVADYGFAVGGMYPVSLTVNDGYVDRTTSVTVIVDNTGPAAGAAPFGGTYDIYVGEDLDLDASGSFDPDDAPSPLTFAWDLDNDGQFNDTTGETPSVTWTNFASLVGYTTGAQSYQIAVKVSDGDLDATATATVNVKLPMIGVEFVDGTMSEKKSPTPQDNGSFRIYRVTPPDRTAPPSTTVAITNISFTLPGGEGRASNGTDYNTITTSGWVIPAGADDVLIDILVIDDTTPESYPVNLEDGVPQPHCEFVDVSLNPPSANNYVIDTTAGSAHSKIADNDRWDWDTSTDTATLLSNSIGVPGYDNLLDSGSASLSYTTVITRTNNSIDVALAGSFVDPGVFSTDTYYAPGYGVRLQFLVNAYGDIELDLAGCSADTGTPDGPLQGYVPAQYQIDNAAIIRTARVRFAGIGVVVDGSVSPIALSAGFTAYGVLSGAVTYTFSSAGQKLEMPTWDADFQLKVVELP